MNEGSPNALPPPARPGDLRGSHRVVLVIGSLVLLVLGGFAWTYYLERTACADSAFFSWSLIHDKLPMSVLGRYGSWLAQLLPVVLVRMGTSLETVLRIYIESVIAFHAFILWILAFKLRDHRAVYALPITLTVGFHYMFYFGISELYQGLSLTLLLWSIMGRAVAAETRGDHRTWLALALLLNLWISFYHQLLVLPLVFILGHEFLGAGRKGRVRLLVMGSIMVLWYLIRIKTMTTSSYEQARMPTMTDLLQYGSRWTELDSATYLFAVWTKFQGLIVLMFAGLVVGIMQRAWLRTLWTIAFTIFFMILVLIVDRDSRAIMIYENYYPVLGLVWAVQFISLAPEQGRWATRSRVVLLLGMCMLGLMQIHRAHYRMAEKVAYLQRMTTFWEIQSRPKVLVKEENYPWNYGIGVWPLGLESALASAVKGPQHAATLFISRDRALLDTSRTRPEQFLGPDWAPLWFSIPSLNHAYFDLPTDTGYFWANTSDTTFDLNLLQLRGPAVPFRLAPDRYSVVPISIHNPTTGRMPSCSAEGKPVRMGYRLFLKDGTEYQRGEETSPLETDIPSGMTYHQGLVIERPRDPGKYWVIADLLVDGQPFGKFTTFDIIVDRWPL